MVITTVRSAWAIPLIVVVIASRPVALVVTTVGSAGAIPLIVVVIASGAVALVVTAVRSARAIPLIVVEVASGAVALVVTTVRSARAIIIGAVAAWSIGAAFVSAIPRAVGSATVVIIPIPIFARRAAMRILFVRATTAVRILSSRALGIKAKVAQLDRTRYKAVAEVNGIFPEVVQPILECDRLCIFDRDR